ncbi:hypothetical protein HUJ05_003558 [Dendroctonus ponderosae]|nr:hypothetical protein HUJ05_003558 [Dendroctonus ponderosae]
MERKIPILSAERPLQSRLPIHKTQLPNIEEGASVLCGRRGHKAFVPTRLTRRSKSVSDLRGALVTDKPKTNIASSSRMPLAATAQKRPLVTTKVNNDGCSKPKVSKKIAPWDYKSKFNDLNDKYQVLQNSSKELASKSEEHPSLFTFDVTNGLFWAAAANGILDELAKFIFGLSVTTAPLKSDTDLERLDLAKRIQCKEAPVQKWE